MIEMKQNQGSYSTISLDNGGGNASNDLIHRLSILGETSELKLH